MAQAGSGSASTLLASLAPLSEWPWRVARPRGAARVSAVADQGRGLVIDYLSYIYSGGDNGFYFGDNNTYWIAGPVVYGPPGLVTLGQGTCLKFASGASLCARNQVGVQCNGAADSPTVLTSANEDVLPPGVASDRLDWSTGVPSQSALYELYVFNFIPSQTFSHLKIRWAQFALNICPDSIATGVQNYLADSSFEYCQTGVYIAQCGLVVQNSSKCRVGTEVDGHGTQWTYDGGMADVCNGDYDGDGKGIPDDWDYQWFGRTLGTAGAAADDDGDGVSNSGEYTAQSNPITRPVLTSTPVFQVVHQGSPASFSCAGAGNYTYQWLLNYQVRGAGGTFSLPITQLSDYGQFDLHVMAPNPQLYTDYYVRLVVCDDWAWGIWQAFNASITPSSSDQVWLTRTPGNPPTVQWNPNSLLYGRTGFTGISPVGYLEPNAPTQITVTALTRRHGYCRGHGMGSPDGFRTTWNGTTIWFVDKDGNPFPATVAGAYVRNPGNNPHICTDPWCDWTVLVFADDLPANITPIPLVMEQPPRFSVCSRTGPTLRMSANLPPFSFAIPNQHDDLSRPPLTSRTPG